MGEDRDHHGGGLAAMLRAGAAGWLADEAAAELLLRHGCWPGRPEFVRRFVGARPGPGAQCPAGVDWRGAVDGLAGDGLAWSAGVALLRPGEQVFDAMLAGWASQQLARNLSFATAEKRQRVVQAFAAHANSLPWQWSPQLVDEWCSDLRAVRHLARSTLRNYTEAVRLFCGYLTDPAYGWSAQCVRYFGTHAVQVCREWNTAAHAH